MEIQSSISQIQDVIAESKQIAVFIHKNPTLDSVASLLALGQLLNALKKDYSLICPDPIPTELHFLTGWDKINTQLGPRNLVIAIKDGKDAVEKVSYFTQGNDFNLVITPQNNNINSEQIQYSFSGLEADLLIILDTIRLNGLGAAAMTFTEEFKNLPLINIDRHTQNTRYGKLNLIDNTRSSTAEIILTLANQFQIEWNADLATLILAGIYGGSHNFVSQTTTAKSFQTVTQLLEKGAQLEFILENGNLLNKDMNKEKNELEKSTAEETVEPLEGMVNAENKKEETAGFAGQTGETIFSEVKPEITDSKNNPETVNNKTEEQKVAAEPLEEYRLPTPILKPHGNAEKDSPFADPTIYRSS